MKSIALAIFTVGMFWLAEWVDSEGSNSGPFLYGILGSITGIAFFASLFIE